MSKYSDTNVPIDPQIPFLPPPHSSTTQLPLTPLPPDLSMPTGRGGASQNAPPILPLDFHSIITRKQAI